MRSSGVPWVGVGTGTGNYNADSDANHHYDNDARTLGVFERFEL